MLQVHEGQCGLCTHFGEEHADDKKLTQIRESMKAAEDYLDSCGHPKHSTLHLKVTAGSGCDGFESATVQ